jgi:hypothetical protein
LRTGAANWSMVRELTRVATPETEEKWLEAARHLRVREVETLVRGRRPGDSPDAPPDPAAQRHVVRMEVSAEAYATYREAVAALRRKSDGPLDQDAVLMLLARAVLGGPSDEGRASYQIAVRKCDDCRRTWQEGSGELVPLGDEAGEKAECDAQHIGSVDAPVPTGRATQTIPPATRRHVMRRDAGTCAVPGCRHATFVDVHHTEPVSEGGDHDPDKLCVLCSVHHTAVHEGQLLIDGAASTGFSFRHADGRPYGSPPRVRAAVASESYAKVFCGLKNMGFREREARSALDAIRSRMGRSPTTEAVLRAALEQLTSDCRSTG